MNELGAQTVVDTPTLVDHRIGGRELTLSAALHQLVGIGQGTHTALQIPLRIVMGTPCEVSPEQPFPEPQEGPSILDPALIWTHATLSVLSMIFGASVTYLWMSL